MNLTKEEFYRLRDDRTNRLTDSLDYHELRVRVIASPQAVNTFCGQVQLLIVANMLARWCRNVEFGFQDAPLGNLLRVNGCNTLHERINFEVREADPFGSFLFELTRSNSAQYTIKVGGDWTPEEPVDFTIDSTGWTVRAGRGNLAFSLGDSQNNPVGPAFAACIGVADAFKVATGLPQETRVRDVTLSTFNPYTTNVSSEHEPPMPDCLSLGSVQVVGIGSVGSAALYLLRMMRLDASLDLLDHDLVEFVNLNRSPIFGVSDVGRPKVAVGADYLRPVAPVEAFAGTYGQYIEQSGRKPEDVDLILPLANEFGVRSTIENNFPPLQIYGTTFEWGINYHRHIPLIEDCSVCRFPEDAQQAPLVCAGAQIETPTNERVDAALPFLSVGAAALAVADLIKLQLPDYPFSPNFTEIDFKGDMTHPFSYQRPRKAGCLCSTRSGRIHEKLIASTRFSQVSLTASSTP
jgi:hypothetical protein